MASCQQNTFKKLTIATAANMQFAMEALTQAFMTQTGIECETIVSSSGKLTAQIIEGAPFDVFVSADMKFPVKLFEKGITTSTPKIYAYGKLVLWSMYDGKLPTIEQLNNPEIKHIALANPKTAPYGVAALEVLEHHQILDQVKPKLVYGESIAQANQFITSKAAAVGFTAKAVVVSPQIKGKGKWIELDTAIYTPIAQGIVILKNDKATNEKAQQFYEFLFSEKGKNILTTFGYLVKE